MCTPFNLEVQLENGAFAAAIAHEKIELVATGRDGQRVILDVDRAELAEMLSQMSYAYERTSSSQVKSWRTNPSQTSQLSA